MLEPLLLKEKPTWFWFLKGFISPIKFVMVLFVFTAEDNDLYFWP